MAKTIFDNSTYSNVIAYPSLADFPVTGESNIYYVAMDTGISYIWDSSNNEYVFVPRRITSIISTDLDGYSQIDTSDSRFLTSLYIVSNGETDTGVGGENNYPNTCDLYFANHRVSSIQVLETGDASYPPEGDEYYPTKVMVGDEEVELDQDKLYLLIQAPDDNSPSSVISDNKIVKMYVRHKDAIYPLSTNLVHDITVNQTDGLAYVTLNDGTFTKLIILKEDGSLPTVVENVIKEVAEEAIVGAISAFHFYDNKSYFPVDPTVDYPDTYDTSAYVDRNDNIIYRYSANSGVVNFPYLPIGRGNKELRFYSAKSEFPNSSQIINLVDYDKIFFVDKSTNLIYRWDSTLTTPNYVLVGSSDSILFYAHKNPTSPSDPDCFPSDPSSIINYDKILYIDKETAKIYRWDTTSSSYLIVGGSDSILYYPSRSNFPADPSSLLDYNKLFYVDETNNLIYRYDTTLLDYVLLGGKDNIVFTSSLPSSGTDGTLYVKINTPDPDTLLESNILYSWNSTRSEFEKLNISPTYYESTSRLVLRNNGTIKDYNYNSELFVDATSGAYETDYPITYLVSGRKAAYGQVYNQWHYVKIINQVDGSKYFFGFFNPPSSDTSRAICLAVIEYNTDNLSLSTSNIYASTSNIQSISTEDLGHFRVLRLELHTTEYFYTASRTCYKYRNDGSTVVWQTPVPSDNTELIESLNLVDEEVIYKVRTLRLDDKIYSFDSQGGEGVGRITQEGGEIFNDYINNVAYTNAHAEGFATTAQSQNSHVEGSSNITLGEASHSEGKSNTSLGDYSHTENESNLVSGRGSHAEGYNNIVSSDYSHAEGYQTTATATPWTKWTQSIYYYGYPTSGSSYDSYISISGNLAIYNYRDNLTTLGNFTLLVDSIIESNGEVQYRNNEGTYTTITLDSSNESYSVDAYDSHNSNYLTITFTRVEIDNTYYFIFTPDIDKVRVYSSSGSLSENSYYSTYQEAVRDLENPKLYGYAHTEGYKTYAIGNLNYSGEIYYTAHAEGRETSALCYDSHAEGSHTYATHLASHAEGSGTTAYGSYSHAEGTSTYAYGDQSHAEGCATSSLGHYSHAEGINTCAADYSNHTEGADTSATGQNSSHAEGLKSYAFGGYGAHAEGYKTCASYDGSHAEGYKTCAGQSSHSEGSNTTAIANYNHAEGYFTYSTGNASHAEGSNASAMGYCSHAEGYMTSAGGAHSHAEGYYTTAGHQSHSEGQQTYALAPYSHTEGQYTYTYGRWSHAEGYMTSALGEQSHAEGHHTTANGGYAHSEGQNTFAGVNAHAEGYFNTAIKDGGHAEGDYTIAVGQGCHSEGEYTNAGGGRDPGYSNAHAEGYQTSAFGLQAHTEGHCTLVNNHEGHAEGYDTTVSGQAGHAEGEYTYAMGTNSHAEGSHTTATNCSHAEGGFTSAGDSYSHAEGYGSKANSYSHAEGYETTSTGGSGSHAEGYKTLSGNYASHTEGYQTTTYGKSAHVEGGYPFETINVSTQTLQIYVIDVGHFTYDKNGTSCSWSCITSPYDNTIYVGKYMSNGVVNYAFISNLSTNTTTSNWSDSVTTDSSYTYNGKTIYYKADLNTVLGLDDSTVITNIQPNLRAFNTLDNLLNFYCLLMKGGNIAYALSSHVEGLGNQAYDVVEHVEGLLNFVQGSEFSHVEGFYSSVYAGFLSHTEGMSHVTGYGTSLNHIEGFANTSLYNVSRTHIEGSENSAQAYSTTPSSDCHIEGSLNKLGTSTHYTHVEGFLNNTSGDRNHIEGAFTTATYLNDCHVEGTNQYASSVIYNHVEGGNNIVQYGANYNHIEGFYNTAQYGPTDCHIEGKYNNVNTGSCHVEGFYNNVASGSGLYNHYEGYGNLTQNNTAYSHLEGFHNTVSSTVNFSHAEGANNLVSGSADAVHIEGRNNLIGAMANYSHAEGYYNTISFGALQSNHVGGTESVIAPNSKNSFIHGEGLQTRSSTGNGQTSFGMYNDANTFRDAIPDESITEDPFIFTIGNGTKTTETVDDEEVTTITRSNALAVSKEGNVVIAGKSLVLMGDDDSPYELKVVGGVLTVQPWVKITPPSGD